MRSTLIGGIVVALLGVTVAGCSVNKDLEKYADRACACKDKDCATKVADEFASWFDDHKDSGTSDEDKAEADAKRMATCLMEKNADLTKFKAAMAKVKD